MKYIVAFLIAIVFLPSCSQNNYIALNDAERGMFLDRSDRVSVGIFFDRRMEGDSDSNHKREWVIVNEDMDYVYFGLLAKQNGFAIINPFYKVNREDLAKQFPGFRNIKGTHVKAKVFQTFIKPIIDERLISICPQSYNIQYGKKQYKLTDKGIEADIQFEGRCYEDKIFNASINVILDASNIEVLNSDVKYN